VIGISTQVVVCDPGSIERSAGKARRVIDSGPRVSQNVENLWLATFRSGSAERSACRWTASSPWSVSLPTDIGLFRQADGQAPIHKRPSS